MTKIVNAMRYAAVAVAMLAGSCAVPVSDGKIAFSDGAANHPITVESQYTAISLPFSAPAAGLMPDDAARFSAFVAAYLERGNGAISVSVPAGRDAAAAISYFGEKLASLGVPRARILVGSRDIADGDQRVEIGYAGYVARTDPCGDWPMGNVSFKGGLSYRESVSDTPYNEPMPNFGCATQHNIAAQVADPRDLIAPGSETDGNAARRATVLGNYEQGKPTAAEKTEDQKAKVSDVGK